MKIDIKINENSATTAISMLKEILAQEKLFSASMREHGIRKYGVVEMNNYLTSSNFNVEHHEALELMENFQKRDFIEIVPDISIPIPVEHENGKSSKLKLEPTFWSVDKNLKRISFKIKDIGKIKNFISELDAEFNDSVKDKGNTFYKNTLKNNIDLPLPEMAQWEKVLIKIKEGKHEIEIFYDNKFIKTVSYIDLHWFRGKKQQKPDRQWEFLCALSVLSATNIQGATAGNMCDMFSANSTDKKLKLKTENVHKIKEVFVKRLQELFKTKENPFVDNKLNYYQPIFTILPEPVLRHEEIFSPRLQENSSHEPNYFTDDDGENLYENSEDEDIKE